MHIQVYHDTVCPWCRIGKANLKQALADWHEEPVEVEYSTFFLNPTIPPEGYNFREYMEAKGNGQVSLAQFFDAPRQAGEKVGLTFNFEQIEHAPNSTLSHQLIALAPENKKEAVIDALYTAYFEEGRNIGDVDVLADIAAAQGLDAASLKTRLEQGEGQAAIIEEARQAQQQGINGVPFFIINQKYAFSGAQPPDIIREVLTEVRHKEAA